MAILAETLVDEWLNRQRFFTVRGVKDGLHEIDLIGIRNRQRLKPEGWHVEVQVSFRPVTYIAPLSKSLQKEFAAPSRSAKRRSAVQLQSCISEWVHHKFQSRGSARERLWPNIDWKFIFVHGVVKDKTELELIENAGVKLVSFHEILGDLCSLKTGTLCGAAGTDIAEIVAYYENRKR